MDAEHRDEGRHQARSSVDGTVWIDGVLHLRGTTRWVDEHGAERTVRRPGADDVADGLTCRLLARSRAGRTTHDLPTSSTAVLVPVPGDDDRVTVRVRTEARLDPRELPQEDGGTWDVCAEPSARGDLHPVLVEDEHEVPARPAVVGTVPYLARGDQDGTLCLESGVEARTLVDGRRLRTAAARVDTAPGEGGRTTVRVAVPVEGVRVFPAGGGDAVGRGTVELEAADVSFADRVLRKMRRRAGAPAATGRFTVVAEGDDAVLHVTVAATPGLWRVATTAHGSRTPLPLLVRLGRDGSAQVVAAPAEPAAAAVSAPPRVSVVMPVYNAADTVEEAVRSAFAQSLPPEQVEIIAVDDGSSDDSLAILRRLQRQHPRMQVFTQAPSGTAAAPRNAGIEASTGRHLFFLDSDDLLTPTALEKMADAADALEADVVLGKMEGFAGRTNVPRRVFRRTTVDADMVANSMMNALGPTKMFRAEHIKRQGIRFPAGLRHGEDQAFVVEAEFTARRIVILTDAVYYRVRGHEVRHTPPTESVIDIRLRKTRLLTRLVERHTEPGDRRDALLPRPFGDRALEGAFRKAYLALEPSARAELVDRVADELGHLWTPGLRARVVHHARPVYDLVFARDPENLTALVEHAGGDPRRLAVITDEDGIRLAVPASVEEAVGRDALRVDPPPVELQLTGLTTAGGHVTALGRMHPPSGAALPTGVQAHWRRRGPRRATAESVEARGTVLGTTAGSRAPDAVRFSIETEVGTLPAAGLWDLWVTPFWGAAAGAPVQLGAERDRSVDTDAVALEGTESVLFRSDRTGHLAIDRDGAHHTVRPARLTALRPDADGRPEAVLHVGPGTSAVRVYAYLEQAESRQRLPWSRVDDEHVAARLPVPFTASTSTMTLALSQRKLLSPVVGDVPLREGSATVVAQSAPGGPGPRTAATVRVTRTSGARAPERPRTGAAAASGADDPIRMWWWRWRFPTELNFGDEVTAPLVERLTGRRVVWTPMAQAELVGAGSVLQMALRERGSDMPAVWGAGMIRPFTKEAPADFVPLAVRGRLSLESLSPAAQASTALGDPGILADRLVDGPVTKRYTLGVIPHYKDATDPTIRALTTLPGTRRIDVAWTPEEVAREIAACHVVLSSSMHGLIFADALDVPNAHLKVSDKLVGGDYKFRDYCSAFGPDRYQPPLTPTDVRDLDTDQLVHLVRTRFRPPTGIDDLKQH
ncbi:glycosyltransferase, partial [Isoptericola cucumis]|uniref:glycosyltransferase n=2 Tax=Isoptericola cucumis TaxID=1776856 RepID=UPI0039EFA738